MSDEVSENAKKHQDMHGGSWGEHSEHPVAEWQQEVGNDYTRLGYWEWVAAREMNKDIESEES